MKNIIEPTPQRQTVIEMYKNKLLNDEVKISLYNRIKSNMSDEDYIMTYLEEKVIVMLLKDLIKQKDIFVDSIELERTIDNKIICIIYDDYGNMYQIPIIENILRKIEETIAEISEVIIHYSENDDLNVLIRYKHEK